MKKFGTPSGAGPGTENEKVGFVGVGTPFFAVGAGGLDEVEVLVEVLGPVEPLGPEVPFAPVGPDLPVEPPGPLEPPWVLPLLPPLGCEEEDDEVVLVLDEEPLDPLDPLDPLGLGLGLGLGLVTVGAPEADTPLTGPTPAGTS